MSGKLSKAEQDDIVVTLAVEVETLGSEEYEELYEQLDHDHKMEAQDHLAEWADDAVGDANWHRY